MTVSDPKPSLEPHAGTRGRTSSTASAEASAGTSAGTSAGVDPVVLHVFDDRELHELLDQARADERERAVLAAAEVFGSYVQLLEPIHRRCAAVVMDDPDDQVRHDTAVAEADRALAVLRAQFGLVPPAPAHPATATSTDHCSAHVAPEVGSIEGPGPGAAGRHGHLRLVT